MNSNDQITNKTQYVYFFQGLIFVILGLYFLAAALGFSIPFQIILGPIFMLYGFLLMSKKNKGTSFHQE